MGAVWTGPGVCRPAGKGRIGTDAGAGWRTIATLGPVKAGVNTLVTGLTRAGATVWKTLLEMTKPKTKSCHQRRIPEARNHREKRPRRQRRGETKRPATDPFNNLRRIKKTKHNKTNQIHSCERTRRGDRTSLRNSLATSQKKRDKEKKAPVRQSRKRPQTRPG